MSSHNSSTSLLGGGADANKRPADDANVDAQNAAKRKRPQSCDTCRSRKIKCVRLHVDGIDVSADNRCVQCRAIDAKCTFDYVPKRPGPQSSFAKTARKEAEAQAQAHHKPSTPHGLTRPTHSRASTSGYTNTPAPSIAGPSPNVASGTGGSPSDDSWYRALAQHNFASGNAGASANQTRSSSWSGATNFDAYLNGSMLAMTPTHFAAMPAASPFDFSPHNVGAMSGPSPAMSASNASSATPGSYAGSASWHAPRSDAGSSRSNAPLAALSHMANQQHMQSQPHTQQQQQQQQHNTHSAQADQLAAFDMSSLAGPESRATPLPLPIPSFSRVQSPVAAANPLPQPQQPPQQPQQPATSSEGARPSRKRKSAPGLSTMYCGPVVRPRSLDDIAPRQTFLAIVSLYFHYLWPLLPIVDRPTFSHDLLNRRDERDDTFLAFVLSLASYTLIQCPRTVIPAPWTVYRRLHRICHLTSRRMQPRVYDPPQLLHVNTLYCDHIYLGTVGKTNAANAVLAEAVRVAYTLALHDESKNSAAANAAPYGLDASSFAHYRAPTANAVERELRKRMFWVLHGSSTTIAMLQDEPALIHAIDACVDLPLAVDEEALANPRHVQSRPSVLCGFLTVTRLHQVMLELLESYRRDRRFPIDDLGVARSRVRYLADVLSRLQHAIDDMPEELRKPVYTHAPPEPIRRPGVSMPSLEAVAPGGQQQQPPPPLQAIGFDAATQTALGNHLSGTSPWPWPAETFTRDGLPNADARSSNNSSATHSPRPSAEPASGLDVGQPPHQALTPLPLTPQTGRDAVAGLTMVDLVNVFRPSPPPSSTPVLSPMCTMHANIVCTESLIRFLVTEYRELVATRIRDLKLRQPASFGAPANAPEDVQRDTWQDAAQKMLHTFNSLPLDALASNGQSLISKIIYVVSALLNRTAMRGPSEGFQYMSSLLATLTRLSQTRNDDTLDEGDDDAHATGEPRGGGGDGGAGPSEGGAGGADGAAGGGHRDAGGERRDDRWQKRPNQRRRDSSHEPRDTTMQHTSRSAGIESPASTPASLVHTDSAPSSAPNTASTTPTAELPASYPFANFKHDHLSAGVGPLGAVSTA